MRCVRSSARARTSALRGWIWPIHCHHFFDPLRFSTDRRHVSQ